MSEIVERAAKAVWDTLDARGLPRTEWADRHEFKKDETRAEARAALLAALDPEDEALREKLARAISFGCDRNGNPVAFTDAETDQLWSVSALKPIYRAQASAVIRALRETVQGET